MFSEIFYTHFKPYKYTIKYLEYTVLLHKLQNMMMFIISFISLTICGVHTLHAGSTPLPVTQCILFLFPRQEGKRQRQRRQ